MNSGSSPISVVLVAIISMPLCRSKPLIDTSSPSTLYKSPYLTGYIYSKEVVSGVQ
jgi:hypothetical protein